MSRGHWRAVAYTPRRVQPCRTCGKPAVGVNCQTCLWRRRSFLNLEEAAANYGSLTGAITEDEWRTRLTLLMKMLAQVTR